MVVRKIFHIFDKKKHAIITTTAKITNFMLIKLDKYSYINIVKLTKNKHLVH